MTLERTLPRDAYLSAGAMLRFGLACRGRLTAAAAFSLVCLPEALFLQRLQLLHGQAVQIADRWRGCRVSPWHALPRSTLPIT